MQVYPAIKARMGDWDYYIVRMTMGEVAEEVELASDFWPDKTLSEAIQRAVDEPRVKQQIVNFLARHNDRFFSSLVVAAIGGNPNWTPFKTPLEINSDFFNESFGMLSFDKSPRYYALDGQHRLRAIQELLEDPDGAPDNFENEHVSVLVVVREDQKMDDKLWLQRYRRLFSSLNRYAKPTDADTNIIMDEDDCIAILTRRLITEHEFFRAGAPERTSFQVQTQGKNMKKNAPQFTSLQTLYEMNKTLLMTPERRRDWSDRRTLKRELQFRPEDAELDRLYRTLANCWNALLTSVPVLRSEPTRMRSHSLPDPNTDGLQDHLLFWPIGQELFVKIARALLNQAGLSDDAATADMQRVLEPLSRVPWDMHGFPWRYLLLIPGDTDEVSWKVRSEERVKALGIAERLLRWLVALHELNPEAVNTLREEWGTLLYPLPPEETAQKWWSNIVALRPRILSDTH